MIVSMKRFLMLGWPYDMFGLQVLVEKQDSRQPLYLSVANEAL